MTSINKAITCCFTGHRSIPAGLDNYLADRITDGIKYLYASNVKTFLTGGAIGFDTLAAQAVIRCQERLPDIKLIVVAPCHNQDKYWNQQSKDTYQHIMKCADDVIYLSEQYHADCMHQRNRYMVDNSSICICYHVKYSGGTAYTVEYARQQGLTVYNLARRK